MFMSSSRRVLHVSSQGSEFPQAAGKHFMVSESLSFQRLTGNPKSLQPPAVRNVGTPRLLKHIVPGQVG